MIWSHVVSQKITRVGINMVRKVASRRCLKRSLIMVELGNLLER
jgi:hypothetical protein